MGKMFSFLAVVIFLTTGQNQFLLGQETVEGNSETALPKNPKTVVLQLSYQNELEPTLKILANGTVIAGKVGKDFARSQYKMKKKKSFARLMKFVVVEQNGLELESGAFRQIAEEHRFPNTGIWTEMKLKVKTLKRSKRISVENPSNFKSLEPQPAIAKRLFNIEDRLKKFHAIAVVGGEKKMKNILVACNRKLRAKFETKFHFTLKHLMNVTAMNNGVKYVGFQSKMNDPKGSYSIQCEISKKGTIKVTSLYDRSKLIY